MKKIWVGLLVSFSVQAVDFVIVPGVRAGAIKAGSTAASLKKEYGKNAVEKDVDVGEGMTDKGMTLFPNDPKKTADILFHPSGKVSTVIIGDQTTDWKVDNGITIGTSLNEVEKLNGKPFKLAGFEWDYSGTVCGYEGGKLETLNVAGKRVLLRLMHNYKTQKADDKLFNAVVGDKCYPSSMKEMQTLNPKVYNIQIEFP